VLLENQGEFDLFRIEIFYSNKEKFKGLLDKITKHESNFQIVSFENDPEEEIKGGFLTVSGKMDIENVLDYELKIQGVSELALELIKTGEENIKYTGISKNIGLISGIRTTEDSNYNLLKSYILMERDAIIINKFTGMNAFPLIIKFNDIDDFIKTLQRIEKTFSAIRICSLEEIDDITVYEQIFSDCSLPILSQYYDEIPVAVLTAIFHLLEKNKLDVTNKNMGFIGLNAASLRLTGLLLKTGFYRILGCDSNMKLMHNFEKQGGLATTQENIFNNSDIIILFKDFFSEDDEKKIGSAQIVISLIDSQMDTSGLKAKGTREILNYGWMDLAGLYPGILKGLLASGIKRLYDDSITKLSKKIVEIKSGEEIIPNVFSGVHEKIEKVIQDLS
jgi:malate dehydrogenase (oxaloacetate-decarboxylating)